MAEPRPGEGIFFDSFDQLPALNDLSSETGLNINQLLAQNAAASGDSELLQPHRDAIESDETRQDRFLQWAGSVGEFPNLADDEQLRAFLLWEGQQLNAPEEPRAGPAGRAPSLQALDAEQILSLQFGREMDQAMFQENQRQNAIDSAVAKMQLAQTTDELGDARRENAMSAMQAALPFMTSPGIMANLEGTNSALQQSFGEPQVPLDLPTTTLPLNEMANPVLAGGPGQIDDALLPLLNSAPVATPGL